VVHVKVVPLKYVADEEFDKDKGKDTS
jgi:hypothetical protein